MPRFARERELPAPRLHDPVDDAAVEVCAGGLVRPADVTERPVQPKRAIAPAALHDELAKLQQAIITDQAKEMAQMRTWRRAWYPG